MPEDCTGVIGVGQKSPRTLKDCSQVYVRVKSTGKHVQCKPKPNDKEYFCLNDHACGSQ